MFRGRIRSIHFVGVGGVGMSGIAEVLLDSGFDVTGSDLRQNEYTRRLAEKGATIHVGHDADQVRDADVVVFSSAVPASNPELSIIVMIEEPEGDVSGGRIAAPLFGEISNFALQHFRIPPAEAVGR